MGKNKLIRARKVLSTTDKKKEEALKEYLQKEKNNEENVTPKLMKISVGNYLINFDFHDKLIEYLVDLGITNSSHKNPANSIVISRENNKDIIISIYDVCAVIHKLSNGTKLDKLTEKNKDLKPVYRNYLLIYGLEEYVKFLSNYDRNDILTNSGYDTKKVNEKFENLEIIEKCKLESLIIELQINEGVDTILVDCPADLIKFVYQTAKAFANIEKGEVRWARCGNIQVTNKQHLQEVWIQQLLEFNLITEEIAEAISIYFNTPGQLIEAYKDCERNGVSAAKMLSDLTYKAQDGKEKKIGDSRSGIIYKVFTAMTNEEQLYNNKM